MAPAAPPSVSRYHPLISLLHWVLTILIIGSLGAGFLRIAPMANADPAKIGLLRIHMIVGIVILALMTLRLIVRLTTSRPDPAPTPDPLLDRLATIVHYAFYLLVLLMVTSGVATAILSGLGMIVFGGNGEPLPPSFLTYPSRIAHGYFAAALAVLIGVHTIAALYHQFILRDGLFRRIWFGRRT
jgi:cytochrome b561